MAEDKNMTPAEAPATPKYRERLRRRYADANPQTDEDWDNLTEQALSEDEANNQVIQDLLDEDKDLASVVSEMIVNGTPFRAAVAKYFDPEDLVAKEGDDDYEYYQKSSEERKRMGQEFRAKGEEKRKNTKEAYDNIDKFAEKKALDEAAKEEFISFVNTLYNDLSVLKLSMSTLEKLYKAMTFDEAVAEAAETGAIDAKNQAIEAARVKKAVDTAGDGVPTPAGGSSPARPAPKKKSSVFDDIPQRKF